MADYVPIEVRIKVGKRKTLKVISYLRDDLVKYEPRVRELIADTLRVALLEVERYIDG